MRRARRKEAAAQLATLPTEPNSASQEEAGFASNLKDEPKTPPMVGPWDQPVARCAIYIAEFWGRPISRALFDEGYRAGETMDGALRQTLRAADAAGFETGSGPLRLADLDPTLLPAIALTKTGAVVIEAKRGKSWTIWDPRIGGKPTKTRHKDLKEIATGDIVLLRPREHDVDHATSRGHWFRSALAANRWSYIQVALAAVVANILGLTTSIFIMVVYDRILPNEAIESLLALTVGVGIALLFDFLIKTLRAGFVDRAGQRADLQIGRTIFDQVLALKMSQRPGSTGAMAASLREFETLRDFFTSASLVALIDLPFICLFIAVIAAIGGPLATVPMVAVPVVMIIALATQPMLARLATRSFAEGQSKQSVLVEAFSGLETVKAAGAEAQMKARWDRAMAAQAGHGVKTRALSHFALNATGFTQQAAQVMIVFYGVFLIAEGSVSMGALIASVILTGRALTPLAQIAQTLVRIAQARTAYKSLNTLMSAERERQPDRRYLTRDRLKGRIGFYDLSFTYPDTQQAALQDVTLDIAPGEKVAVLGPVGSGKSTLTRLLLGLYEPQSGSVRVDGTDIRQIDPGDLRRNIGTMLQDNWLFSGSLRENIAIGAPRASDADILEAARLAGVDAFAALHPEGYDMAIKERGEGLSGGQRQSIALARALLGKPAILVLDEPTSSMDVVSETALIDRLKTGLPDQTAIFITHRKSLLALVDRVIVVQGGRVIADGPRDEILASAGGPT